MGIQIVRWSELHALVVTVCTFLALAGLPLSLAAALSGVSFAALIFICRGQWASGGRFGLASWVTAGRLLGVVLLPGFIASDSISLALGAACLLVLDGIDGWLARRWGLVSEFGEYFDKEVDAFFMLILCLMLYQGGRLGGWIVLPGLLRYGFVFFLKFARPPAAKERQTTRGKWIYLMMMVSLIFAFTPFPHLYTPAAALMTGVLVYSFAEAVVDLYRSPRDA